jgi:hypothetical protein
MSQPSDNSIDQCLRAVWLRTQRRHATGALLAFARERLSRFPSIDTRASAPYDGHVLVLWDDKLAPEYGPYRYGLAFNECVHLQIITLKD